MKCKWSGISLHSWNLSSYNCLIHEHWKGFWIVTNLKLLVVENTYLSVPYSFSMCSVAPSIIFWFKI